MHIAAIAVAAALLQPTADIAPPPAATQSPTPMGAFLLAADRNDMPAMEAAMASGSAGFLKKISNCYLRRVYKNDTSGDIIGAWMCAEGEAKSRVVLANVAIDGKDKVVISRVQETRNSVPAPKRTGSAF